MRHATQAELMPKETLWSWRGKGGSWNINLREELMAWRGASANTHRFPSSPAAPDWNQQQCPCLFCMNPFLFFSQSRFLKTQTAKKEKEKSTCVQKEKKTPTIHSSPRAVWNKWEFSSVPLSKKQWAKKKKIFSLHQNLQRHSGADSKYRHRKVWKRNEDRISFRDPQFLYLKRQ